MSVDNGVGKNDHGIVSEDIVEKRNMLNVRILW